MFDLDGTLADTSRDLAAAVNHVRRRRGLPDLSTTAVCDFVGEGARRLVERVLPGVSPEEIDRGLEVFLAYYTEHLLDETVLYGGVAELLCALNDERISCSVLSNKPEALCRAVIDGLGLKGRFICILGGDSLATRKPDPGGVEFVRHAVGLPPEAVLLVGDSVIDRQTAAAAGVDFCGVSWGFGSRALEQTPLAWRVNTPAEILAIVQRGNTTNHATED